MNMLELMGAFHDIDALKGRVCGACEFYLPGTHNHEWPPGCRKGCQPLGPQDGCGEWQAKPDRQARQLAAVILSLCVAMVLMAGSSPVEAQSYWRLLPSGYQCWGCWREWPRGNYGFTPGYRYYGPGYFRPFSYWQRSPRYRY